MGMLGMCNGCKVIYYLVFSGDVPGKDMRSGISEIVEWMIPSNRTGLRSASYRGFGPIAGAWYT